MASGKYDDWLEPDNLILLTSWARDGLTYEDIAKNMGISIATLKEWRKKFQAISTALKKGREVSDYIMENALYKKGIGFTVKVKKPIKVKRTEYESGKKVLEEETIEFVEEEVYIPPDTTAQIFWLKNRKPQEWRDKREHETKLEFESDGFIEALKGQVADTFKDAGDAIET